MRKSYGRFIAIGVLFLVLGVGAGVYLLVNAGEVGVREVPTELQLLGSTTTLATSATGSTIAKSVVTTTTKASAAVSSTVRGKDANGFTLVPVAQLPKEAQQTLALLDKGGPFPYERDGIVFQNREKILPKQASTYYREYTVVTPGESDRGARRDRKSVV